MLWSFFSDLRENIVASCAVNLSVFCPCVRTDIYAKKVLMLTLFRVAKTLTKRRNVHRNIHERLNMAVLYPC